MPLARIITDYPDAASHTIRALRDSGYIIEIISTTTRPAYRADLVLRADENGLCQPDIHRLQAANVYFADLQTSSVDAPYDSEYQGPYEREFVLAPAWRAFKAKLAAFQSRFVSGKPQTAEEEFISPSLLHLEAPAERRQAPAVPVVEPVPPLEEEYVPPAYAQFAELEPLEPPVFQDIPSPVHFESMMPMAPEVHESRPIAEPVVEKIVAEPVVERVLEAAQPEPEPVAVFAAAPVDPEPAGPSRLQEELAAFRQHARALAATAVAEGKHWWAHSVVAAGNARDLVWKRSFAMAAALAVAFLFGFNAASQRDTTPNLDPVENQAVEPATPVVPAAERSNVAAGGIQKASLVTAPVASAPAPAARKPAAKARRIAVRDQWDEEEIYDEDENVERYGSDVIVRHYPSKKVIASAKTTQRGTRKISDLD